MDGTFGTLVLQPDQMQIMNPILILTLVPIMDRVVYPLIKKCGFNFTPLKRMTVGMFLAAMAFVCAAVVQIQIDKTMPVFPTFPQSQLKVVNLGSTELEVSITSKTPFVLGSLQATEDYMTFDKPHIAVYLNTIPIYKVFTLQQGERQTLIIPSFPNDMYLTPDLTDKPAADVNAVRFVNGMSKALNVSNVALLKPSDVSNNTLVPRGSQTFTISDGVQTCQFSTRFGVCGAYTFLIPSTLTWAENCGGSIVTVEDIHPNTVHLALQIPQYFFITAGEVVFSVTGLEFSYSQAPSNMKAVLQAGWLLTVAVGNIIVLIVATARLQLQKWAEYVLFAALLVAVCIIFSIMAHFYTYINPAEIEAKFKQNEELETKRERK